MLVRGKQTSVKNKFVSSTDATPESTMLVLEHIYCCTGWDQFIHLTQLNSNYLFNIVIIYISILNSI